MSQALAFYTPGLHFAAVMPKAKPRKVPALKFPSSPVARRRRWHLLVIDQEPVRQAATRAYRQTKDRLSALRATVERYATGDRPAFGGWLAARFGPLLTELRELDGQIAEKGRQLDAIRLMTFFGGCSPYEAYQEVLKGQAEAERFAAKRAAGENPDEETFDEEDPFDDVPEEIKDFFGFAQAAPKDGSPPEANSGAGSRAADRRGQARPTRPPTPEQQTKSQRLKTAYRAVVRRLHPDRNPDRSEYDQQLWHDAQNAYEKGDLERLEAILAAGALEGSGELPADSGLGSFLALIRQMEASIRQLERQTRGLKKDFAWNFTAAKSDRESLARKVGARLRDDVAASRADLAAIEADLAFCRQPPARRPRAARKPTGRKPTGRKPARKPKK